MQMKILMIMDDIADINYEIDTNFALMLTAKQRGSALYYAQLADLWLDMDQAYCRCHAIDVFDCEDYYQLAAPETTLLTDFDLVLMRKDPPYDVQFHHATYILEAASEQGLKFINNPAAIRHCNEKFAALWFPQFCSPTLVSCDRTEMAVFFEQHQDVVCKPLNAMGGRGVKRLTQQSNFDALFDELSHGGAEYFLMQRYIPQITEGDKRIFIIDGKAYPYALLRIPAEGQLLANIVAGGHGEVVPLTDTDKKICNEIGPVLKRKNIHFAGIDLIGPYLTEINVTSPSGVREVEEATGNSVCGLVFDTIKK